MARNKRQDYVIQGLRDDVAELMDKLSTGQLTPKEWHGQMEDLLMEGHLGAYLVASGLGSDTSLDVVDPELGKFIASQLSYLDNWADELDLEDPRNPSRGAMYANAAATSWSMGDTAGWPLPTHPGQDTDCLSNCKCEWRITVLDAGQGDADAYWERHADDSCDTCVSNAGKYYPLHIRGGQAE